MVCLRLMATLLGEATLSFLARLDEVQEELFYYPRRRRGVGASKMLKFYVKIFYVMGKALPGELSCPCDRYCFLLSH